jgi:cyanate permease
MDARALKAIDRRWAAVLIGVTLVPLITALSPINDQIKQTIDVIMTPVILCVTGIPIVRKFVHALDYTRIDPD